MWKCFYLILLLIAPAAQACEVHEESFLSEAIARGGPKVEEHYLVVTPNGFSKPLRYSAVYFLHGRGGERHWPLSLGLCEGLDQQVAQGKTPFVMILPDGQNSYWMNGALTHENWGDLVTHELVQDAQKKYRLIENPKGRLIAGISMGGHGAIQLSLNFPGIFGAIGAHSPVLRTQEEASSDFYYEFGTGADYQARDPFSLMKFKGKKLMGPIYIDMGGEDPWLSNTTHFEHYLQSVGVSGVYRVGDDAVGGHQDGYWKYHFPEYLAWYSEQLQAPSLR